MEMGLTGGSLFQIGQVVLSRKGKDAGKWYVVVKIQPEDNRIFVSDGDKFRCPNRKPRILYTFKEHDGLLKKLHRGSPEEKNWTKDAYSIFYPM